MNLRDQIVEHEGLRLKAYQDSRGIWTIGIGTNLQTLEISQELAFLWCRLELDKLEAKFEHFKWYTELNEPRRAVIINMAYNLGYNGFFKFRKTINFIKAKDFEDASEEMLDSAWADQVGRRATELSEQMKTGNW